MESQEHPVTENSLYKITQLDRLAIIRFKAELPIADLYKVKNSQEYFVESLKEIADEKISTRLFIFSDTFSEQRFDDFFKTIDTTLKSEHGTGEYRARFDALARFTAIKQRFIRDCLDSDKLNLFALEGSSIGLWLSTILCGDYAILSENSQFTFPFLEEDIPPLGDLVYYLDQYASKAAVDDLLLRGKPITANDLHRWGLVNRVVPADCFEEEVINSAIEISRKSPHYVNKVKNYKHRLNRRLLEIIDL